MNNNLTKQYTFNTIQYGYSISHKKWKFTKDNFSFYVSLKGKVKAEKICHILNAGLNRTKNNGLDNMARANISKLTLG